MDLVLDRDQPLHFVGVGGIGMSALAGILVERGFSVSGSDPKSSPVLRSLAARGVRVFSEQSAATIQHLLADSGPPPLVVLSSAVRQSNPEVAAALRHGLRLCHRSDVLAALINSQPSIAVAGSHGKTTTSTLIATLLEAAGQDPTAVIGGIVPAFESNGRQGAGRLLVAEADESDGSLVKFRPSLAVLTNIELDHTDHYPDLASLIATLRRFAEGSTTLLANRDCPVLRDHFHAGAWWSIEQTEGVTYAALATLERGDGTEADFYENGVRVGRLDVPLPGRHNLSNVTGALAACRLEGVPFDDLRRAIGDLRAPGRRFDCRGLWHDRIVVDDYAHHPSEVAATLSMARLMVESGRSPLPSQPRRLLAVFQPHRYSRTAQFLGEFARALALADRVIVAPLYSAGEAPIEGVSSEALAAAVQAIAPSLPVQAASSLDQLTDQVAALSEPGDLVLAMGAGDVNSLWERLGTHDDPGRPAALVV
ncbi:MAG: UDP-N-acetylmuramate--L-alanine ligase [Cyanobacteriota bacterium]|nr:UDP-N-acetylmuramate--L-alanine ligase [Cyanobacteriota bacterium]